jgi:molybdopterin/thiamine biosynthesis adenylyltransferase
MKIGIVGLGGIGSHLCRFIAENKLLKEVDGLDNQYIAIDNDKVETKNLRYTTYTINDLEKPKVKAISERFGLEYLNTKIDDKNCKKILGGMDIIVLCVDNSEVRKLLLDLQKPFIDIRAKGKAVCIYQLVNFTDGLKDEYLKSLDSEKEKGDSCQYEIDLNSGFIQFGMLVSASIGFQYLVSLIRDTLREKEVRNQKFIHSF